MIYSTRKDLRIASFYLTLTAEPEFSSHPSAIPGKNILDAIISASECNVDIQVILDYSNKQSMSNGEDVKKLQSIGVVKYETITERWCVAY